MGRLLAIVVGLLLVVGMVSAQPPGQLPTAVVTDPISGKEDTGSVRVGDTIHTCGPAPSLVNVNEGGAMYSVQAQVHQAYMVTFHGLKIEIEKWRVGRTEFLQNQTADLPSLGVLSNYDEILVTLCDVVNPEIIDPQGNTDELVIGVRLRDSSGNLAVGDNTNGGICILDADIVCGHCNTLLFNGCSGQYCLLNACSHAPNVGCVNTTDPCCGSTWGAGADHQSSTSQDPTPDTWVEENEKGVGVDPLPSSGPYFDQYTMEVYAESDWDDYPGDYNCGQVKIVFHPQL